jgi:hypothetical protein
MKTGDYALCNAENKSDALGTVKNEYGDTQHMKTGPVALGTAKNEFGIAKHENGNRHPPYRRKRVREGKT